MLIRCDTRIDGRTVDHAAPEQIRLMAIRRVREGEDPGVVILFYNPSITLLDQNNASTSGTAGNLLAVSNPDSLGATAIQATLPSRARRN